MASPPHRRPTPRSRISSPSRSVLPAPGPQPRPSRRPRSRPACSAASRPARPPLPVVGSIGRRTMASSCIPAGLWLDLEMAKAAAPPRPAHSAASSTFSAEASNAASSSATSSVASLSLKRPRKRPSQTYNEAAALLASMYPACSDLIPPFPVPDQAAFLLRDLPPTPRSPAPAKSCPSPSAVSSVFREFRVPAPSPGTPEDSAASDVPGELDFDDDDGFDTDSILCGVDESAAGGIDGIMGKLSMENNVAGLSTINSNLARSKIHPYLRNLMVLGLGLRQDQCIIDQALKRHSVDPEWWMCPAIPVKDICPALLPLAAVSEKRKSKKKVLGTIYEEGIPESANGDPGALTLPEKGLGLSLNTETVLKA